MWKTYNPKPLKQIAIENIKIDDEEINKKLGKRWLIQLFYRLSVTSWF